MQSKKAVNPDTLVEKVLIAKIVRGDASAFSFLFSAYYKDLVLFATSFTRNTEDAEETVQDIFVKLWEDHENLSMVTSLKSYLLKAVRNKCIDRYRHEKIKQAHSEKVLENPERFINDVDDYILHSELQEKLEVALNRLPADLSRAFRLNRNNGMKYQEIADLIGVSLRTVEDRIAKTLVILRNELKDFFHNT